MRKTLFVLVAAMMIATTVPAFAELQNVTVGGELRIRGNWYSDANLSFLDDSTDTFFVEQRTKVNVKADFTDDVSAFIELDSYNVFGDQFRGLTTSADVYEFGNFSGIGSVPLGIDNSDGTPVSFYQGYIEMRESWGYPLTFRIGRSEMQHGSEFLVGNNDTSSVFRGLSFDGLWGTYTHDQFNVTGFWTRLATNNVPGGSPITPVEDSADINFSGVYGSYTGIEDMTIDGFYYFYHQALTGPLAPPLTQAIEFHTFGARFAGSKAQFDWELNGAYQTGDSGLAAPSDDVNAFAIQGSLGYTFDIEYQPRIFIQGAYYSGDEEDGAFNRLFSDHEYSEFIDVTDLSNIWFVGGGASAQVTEAINLSAVANYYTAVEDFGAGDEDLGIEVALYMTYNYSDDLYFQAGYAHFFAGDGVAPGQFVTANGFGLLGGAGGDDDLDYVFLETGIKF